MDRHAAVRPFGVVRLTAGRFACLAVSCQVSWSCLAVASSGRELLDVRLWGTDQTVAAIARSGKTLYVGGGFGFAGRCSGGGVPVAAVTGKPLPSYASVTGIVRSAIPDGAGGWYIGGEFAEVSGVPHANLAHVLASGEVARWSPSTDGSVWALERVGNVLYLGGQFRVVCGKDRPYLAAVDLPSGSVLDWNPQPDSYVFTLAVGDSILYAGGHFQVIGLQPRSHIAAFSLTTGEIRAFNGGANRDVYALAAPDSLLYVGGNFSQLGGQPRSLVGCLDNVSGNATSFDPAAHGVVSRYDPDPLVACIAVADSVVYVGGTFTSIGGQAKSSLAALSRRTGLTTAWGPTIDQIYPGFPPPIVEAITVAGNSVYVGGAFESVSGMERQHGAALDVITGGVMPWNPRTTEVVLSVAIADTVAYLGGDFDSIWDWQPRRGLAALDLATGEVTSWNPSFEGFIDALATLGDTVYVGGSFSSINGVPRNGLAAIDASGKVIDWNPNSNGGEIRAILATESAIYVGGDFTTIGGEARRNLAALDPAGGAALPWQPDPNDIVVTLARSGNTLYAGGFFSQVSGNQRAGLAAIDCVNASVTEWDPGCDGIPKAFALTDTALYVAGGFTAAGGVPRDGIASLDLVTGRAGSWFPRISGSEVGYMNNFSVAACNGAVFMGGDYTRVNLDMRYCFAAIDAVTGAAEPWDPASNFRVFALASYGDTVYAGGSFRVMGGLPRSGLAAIIVPRSPAAKPKIAVGAASIEPNPCRSVASVRFATPAAGSASISIYDLQGRRVANLLDRIQLPAGQQEIALPTEGLRAGLYICRLKTDWFETARKIVVVR